MMLKNRNGGLAARDGGCPRNICEAADLRLARALQSARLL
jgi:hypothetical protein